MKQQNYKTIKNNLKIWIITKNSMDVVLVLGIAKTNEYEKTYVCTRVKV